ncbi:MAG TPA: thiamine ABC transporter substrate binding subunit [Devosiaceae bacterium]|nr:thiamine ABC transporter substrate binding subunit [Devosiaceae bacterium]
MVLLKTLVVAVLALFATSALAAEQPTLTVYTYQSFASDYGPGPAIKKGFEAQCHCTLDFVSIDSAISALRRVQLEGATTKADVLLGLDTSISGEARATGLFAPHGLTLTGLDLPTNWTDPDFVPFDYGYFAFVYDTTKVKNPPKSFEDLIAEPASFKIALEDPRSDTPGLGLLLWIKAAYGDKAPEIWKGLKPHIATMARSWDDAYGLFLKGDADMALSYTTSPAYHAIEENKPNYAFAAFSEGHYPQIEVAGILKSSRQQDLARQFLTYLTSADAQKIIPTTNWMYPVRDIGADLPAAFNTQAKPAKILSLDEKTITANKAKWIDEALTAIR